jgi:hypothetical protein
MIGAPAWSIESITSMSSTELGVELGDALCAELGVELGAELGAELEGLVMARLAGASDAMIVVVAVDVRVLVCVYVTTVGATVTLIVILFSMKIVGWRKDFVLTA